MLHRLAAGGWPLAARRESGNALNRWHNPKILSIGKNWPDHRAGRDGIRRVCKLD
jgi:hypothetical protein